MKAVFAGIFLLLLFAGCSDETPRAGLYWAEFYTVDSNNLNVTLYDNSVQVTEPTGSSIEINGSTLAKKGNNISGTIAQIQPFQLTSAGVSVNGTWKRKGGYFRITGDYTAFTVTGNNYCTCHWESY